MKARAARALLASSVALGVMGWAGEALAEPVRILVAAGNKLGLAAERPLKFASTDASRVRDVVVSLGGVRAEHAFVLAEPTRAQLFAAVDRARAEARKHSADEVTLLFYFSGHGDRDAIHLGDDRVLLSDLSTKLAEVPAGLRIAITDACRATREKGFTADEPFAIRATNVPQATGQVWLHASSDGEAAQESDELQGAIFTHAWINGLRGAADVNGDARVTLDESFAFAHSQTMIRSAKSSGVLQKPEAVVSLRETSPVVLTETAARMATLSLPAGRDAHFLVYSAGAKTVLSELWSLAGAAHRASRAAGSVRRAAALGGDGRNRHRRNRCGRGAQARGPRARADDPRRPRAQGRRRRRRDGLGADCPLAQPPSSAAHHEASAGYDAGANVRTSFVHGPRASWSYAWKHLALSVGGGADFTGRSLPGKDERLVSGYGRASIEYRLPIGAFTLRGGGGGRAGVVAQTISPTDGATDPASAAPASRGVQDANKRAFTFGPEVFIAGRLALDRRQAFFIDVGATGSMLFLREEASLVGVAGITGGASLGARF